jgi:hypothetical protein
MGEVSTCCEALADWRTSTARNESGAPDISQMAAQVSKRIGVSVLIQLPDGFGEIDARSDRDGSF